MISTAAQRTTSSSPVLWHPKPAQTLSQQTDNNDTTQQTKTVSSEATASSEMPSNATLLASNNIKIKPTTISTAPNYQNWGLEIKGNQLFLEVKGQTPKAVKTGSPEELQAIKQLFKPENVQSYETSQGENNNCSILGVFQEMMLTGGRHLAELIGAVGYNSEEQKWRMTYTHKDGTPHTYTLSQEEMASKRPPNDYTFPASKTHQNLSTLIEGTFRRCLYADYDYRKDHGEEKGKTPDDPQNTNFLPNSLLLEYLNSSVRKTKSNIFRPDRKSFTFEQLVEYRKKYPNTTLTISIDPYIKNQNGYDRKTAKGNLWIDTALENKLKELGIASLHAYTLLAVDEQNKTITIVNPWDSSKAIVLDAKTTPLFFNQAVQANNATDKNPIAAAPAPEETA